MAEAPRRAQAPSGIQVEDALGRRPFMRGIMVHSLMARGLSFEDAFRVANQVRDQIRGRKVVRDELPRLIQKELGGEGVLEALPVQLPRTIHVVEGTHRTPFSKGVLAQSLLAAAIAPDQAFEVAREIEAELLRRLAEEVGRDQLRALVTETLERTMGERVAGRYRIWRAFQESDRPMILLLAGAAGVGKTALAPEVAYRLGIARVTSTDSIRQVMRIMLSPFPLTARLLPLTPPAPTWIATTGAAPAEKILAVQQLGAEVIILPEEDSRVALKPLMKLLGERRVQSLLVEGGAETLGSFFDARLVDKFYSFYAPKILGGNDAPGILAGKGVTGLKTRRRRKT